MRDLSDAASTGGRPVDGITIRPISLPDERDLFAGHSVATFSPTAPWEKTRDFWGRYITGLPYFRPGHWLGAFRGDRYLGGVAVYQRALRVGIATVPTACVASLHVLPEHRGQGIGLVLLDAAERLADRRGDALILLHGIEGFYRRLGYADVFDPTYLCVSRRDLAEWDGEPAAATRPMRVDDAGALLALFDEHFLGRTGAFQRDIRLQGYFLESRIQDDCPIVTCGPEGQITGYLIHGWSRKPWRVEEAVAEDWPAALALLRAVAARQDELGRRELDVQLPCPLDSVLAMVVADNLRSSLVTEHDPDEGWMAKCVDETRLTRAVRPELERRWVAAGPDVNVLHFGYDQDLDEDSRREDGADGSDSPAAGGTGKEAQDAGEESGSGRIEPVLTPRAMCVALFGYRPIRWLARPYEGKVDPVDMASLEVLHPFTKAWIPGTDAF